MTDQQPEIHPLDKPQVEEAYILVKISVDDFSGIEREPGYMKRAATQYARDATFQVMTETSIVTYDATALESFVWYDTEEEMLEAQKNNKK